MDQKNLLLAIVLSVGILVAFQYLFETVKPPTPSKPAETTAVAPKPSGATPPAPGSATVPQPGEAAPAAAAPAETREAALADKPRVKIDTPRLHGSIALVGGRIDDLTLATYHETVDRSEERRVGKERRRRWWT